MANDTDTSALERGISRRTFLAGMVVLTAACKPANKPAVEEAVRHAHQAVSSGAPAQLSFFSKEQAAEIEAMAAQIIPSDGTPGAREAGSVYFIDRALTTFDKDSQSLYTKGLVDLQAKTRGSVPGKDRFSNLDAAQQVEVLTAIETTPFFNLVRQHTIVGFFADPAHGGNNDSIGWQLIGFENKGSWEAPYGFYDREQIKNA